MIKVQNSSNNVTYERTHTQTNEHTRSLYIIARYYIHSGSYSFINIRHDFVHTFCFVTHYEWKKNDNKKH